MEGYLFLLPGLTQSPSNPRPDRKQKVRGKVPLKLRYYVENEASYRRDERANDERPKGQLHHAAGAPTRRPEDAR